MAEKVEYTLTLQDLLTNKLYNADLAAEKLEGTISLCKASLLALSAGAVYMGKQFVSSMVDAGTKVEDARVGLTTLLGDANEAGRVIKNTMTDATKTPFAFEGLLAANKALISAGENSDHARETVLNLANAIAATGGGDDELQRMVINLQQIRNTGVATALDIKQFAYAGINVYRLLADATGKPIEKVKEMKVSYELLTDALRKAHEQGGAYEGGLENMANNTSVRISNLADSMFQLKVQMFDDLKPAIDSLVTTGLEFISMLRDAWSWTVKHKEEVKALGVFVGVVVGGLVAYNIAMRAYDIYTGAAAIATELATAFELARAEGLGLMTAAQWALNVAMDANPIGLIIIGLAALGSALYYAYNKSETFRSGVSALWYAVKTYVGLMIDSFKSLFHVMHGIWTFDFDEFKSGLSKMKDVVVEGATQMGQAAADGYWSGVRKEAQGRSYGLSFSGINDAISRVNGATDSPKGAKRGAGSPVSDVDISASKATGTKSVTLTINIGKLIERFEIRATTIQDSAAKTTELVSKALLNAVNQGSMYADI